MYVWGQELKQKVLTVLGTAQVNFAFKEECTKSALTVMQQGANRFAGLLYVCTAKIIGTRCIIKTIYYIVYRVPYAEK